MRRLGKITAEGRRFRDDESGVVVIWYALMLAVTIAVVGVAVDVVALMNLNSSQQEVADAAALAGADKLDGTLGAISRARTAATSSTSLKNFVYWSNDNASVACPDGTTPCPIDSVKFYETLAALKAGTPETTNDKKAAFIKVTTTRRGYIASFMQLVGAASGNSTASAAAVSQYLTCAPLQSFMCNPYEPPTGSTGDGSSFIDNPNVHVGDQFVLTQGSGSDAGNWGLIQPPGTTGNNESTHAPYWSEQGTSKCVVSLPGEFVRTTAPGNTAKKAVAGMNVRFDRMTNVAGVDLTSAPVVISGFKVNGSTAGTSCSRNSDVTPTGFTQTNLCTDANPSDKLDYCTGVKSTPDNYTSPCISKPGSCPLPRDPVFTQLGNATGWGSMLKGNGASPAALSAYWKNHHTGSIPSSYDTRYKIYQAEVDGTAPFTQNVSKEAAAPQCELGNNPAGGVDRRLINVGIVDCGYWGLHGRDDLPTLTLSLKMFMTEPATTEGEIYAELVEINAANQSGGPIKHIVRLVQ